MGSIVKLPKGSGKTPFEAGDEQYFYATNTEISTLADRQTIAEIKPLEFMQIGYSQLYFYQRLILWNRTDDSYQTYPETDEVFWIKNKYCLIGNVHLHIYAPNDSYTFSGLTEAEEYMKSLPDSNPNSAFAVARMLQEEYWH